MKMKRSVCFVTAFFLLCVLATTPAAAAKKSLIKIRTMVKLPAVAIEVTVPTGTRAYLNPSKVSIRMNQKITDGQILSETSCIENKSVVPLEVNVTVSGAVKSGSKMILSPTSTIGSGSTEKKAFIYFEMQSSTDPTAEPSWDNGYDASKHIVVGAEKKSIKNIVILGAADEDDRFGMFHLTGDCVENPTTKWTVSDGFYSDVVFTFNPILR